MQLYDNYLKPKETKKKKDGVYILVYGQGQGFQGSALPVAKTESPKAIPARTTANTNNLLSESNSILFIESPFLVVNVFDKCAYISSTSSN